MKQLELRSKLSKKFKATTNSNHNYLIIKNVINRKFFLQKCREKLEFRILLTSKLGKDLYT
jgi:hypothetical protein